MPRIISPIRKKPVNDPQNLTQTRVFNYKLFFTSLIILSIIGCSILFCGIQDTLQYLKNIVLLGILLIILVSIIKS
jgi:hypothetical protein